ncbi:hypothetical protein ABT273_20755 [Streptomyces humidus]|uniref:hypothetical protein n=1 Tax=Streptomyces humidus TaxID=52259 RepID=UPI003317D78E
MTVSPPSPATVPDTAFVRDRLVCLLMSLNRMAARDLTEEELAAQTAESGLADGWLGELCDRPDRDAVLASLPAWLTVADDSGLAVLVEVASGGSATAGPAAASDEDDAQAAAAAAEADAARERMRRLLPLLGGEVPDQLADLWADCPARPAQDGPPERDGAARSPLHAAVADGAGGRVAITLADASDPVGGAGWVRPLAWAGPCLIQARDAVVALLSGFGGVEAGARPALPVGVWPAAHLQDQAVGLGYALDALAGFTGLPRPDLPAVGVPAGGQTLAPMTDADLTGRVEALALIGVTELLAPTARGWVRAGPGGVREPVPGVSAALTLDGAATAVWGEAWTEWKHARHREELLALGWVVQPLEARPDDALVKQVADLREIFHGKDPKPKASAATTESTAGGGGNGLNGRNGGKAGKAGKGNREGDGSRGRKGRESGRARRVVAVVGGTVRSGKSTIARLLAQDLRGRGWQVQALRSTRGELPDRDPLIEAARRAVALTEREEGRPCLLILDGLLPLQGGNRAVDELLPLVSEAVHCSVLALLEYDVSANFEWSTDSVDVVPAVVGGPHLEDFVKAVALARPGEAKSEAGLAEVRRGDGSRDLDRIIRVMTNGGREDPVLVCFGGLGVAQQNAVADMAAASLIHSGVPAETLADLTEEERETLGVETLDGQGLIRIPSVEDSTRILQRVLQIQEEIDAGDDREEPDQVPVPGPERLREQVVERLLPRIEALMRHERGEVLPRLLGARLYHAEVAAELLKRTHHGAFAEWLSRAQAAELARCLSALGNSLSEDIGKDVILEFTKRLEDEPATLRLFDLVTVIRGIRHAMSTGALALKHVVAWLHAQVNAVLSSGEGTAQERLHLLDRIEWFQNADLDEIVVKRVAEVVTGLDPSRPADYFLVLRALRLQRRLWRRVADDVAVHYEDAAGYHPVDQEPGPEELVAYQPRAEDGFAVILAGMMLRRHVERTEWSAMIDEHRDLLQPALDASSPRDVITALHELRRTSGMHRNEIFKRAIDTRHDNGRYLGALRALVRRATPMETVELLRVVQGLHAWCACLLLSAETRGLVWTQDNDPDESLVARLVDATKNDPKAAGMLLSVTHAVESPYHQSGQSFAQRLGDGLGEATVLEWLVKDPRPSVKYHLVKGLWEAQVGYRERCLEQMVEIVALALTTSRRVWGPRLALWIGADPEFGPGFLHDLRERVGIDDLLVGMSVWSPPDAQAEFHRLARALYPTAALRYAQTFHAGELAQRLANASSVAVAEACREIARTMRHTDGISGAALLKATGRLIGRPHVWTDRLDTVRTGEEFTQFLSIVSDIDRGFVRRLLGEYGERTMRTAVQETEELRLVWKTRSAMYQNPLAATGMLSVLEQIAELGRAVYARLSDDAVLMKIFTDELQLLQNPSEQYMAALHLARIGIGPHHRNADWTETTFELKKRLITTFSNPRVIRDVLRTVALWERRWAVELVDRIELGKMERRLRLGLIADLQPTVGLAALLISLGDEGKASATLDMLEGVGWERVVERVDLPSAVLLLRLVGQLRPHHGGTVASAVNARVVTLPAREIVLDDRAMWREVGHACQALAAAGRPVQGMGGLPAREPLLADAPAVSRALHWFPATPWRARYRTRAVERLISHPPRSGGDLALALAGAASAGRLPDLLAVLPDLKPLAAAGTRDLADLTEFAGHHPALAAVLRPYHALFDAHLQSATSVASLDTRRLRLGITAVAAGTTFDDAG